MSADVVPYACTSGKKGYPHRMAADAGLVAARTLWRRTAPERRTATPPCRVYRCPGCQAWHLTSRPTPPPGPPEPSPK